MDICRFHTSIGSFVILRVPCVGSTRRTEVTCCGYHASVGYCDTVCL